MTGAYNPTINIFMGKMTCNRGTGDFLSIVLLRWLGNKQKTMAENAKTTSHFTMKIDRFLVNG